MICGFLLVPALLTAAPTPAAVSSGFNEPTPNLLFQLQKQNREHPWLRVATDSARLTLRARRIDETGLGDLSSRRDDPPPPARIAWRTIARIDEITTRERQGRVSGFLLAGLAGAILGNMIGASDGKGKSDGLIGLVTFGSVGAWQGGRFGLRFEQERPWYVAAPAPAPIAGAAPVASALAETTLASAPQQESREARPAAVTTRAPASAGVLRACSRIGRNNLIRMRGDFGEFQGFAAVVGPQGMEGLRTELKRNGRAAGSAPAGLVTWDRIDRVEVRGGSARKGAVAGGLILGTLGGLVGAAAVAVADGTESSSTAFVEGALVGGACGAVLGGLLCAAIPGWHLVYRRR
jgi:hypothetical protein